MICFIVDACMDVLEKFMRWVVPGVLRDVCRSATGYVSGDPTTTTAGSGIHINGPNKALADGRPTGRRTTGRGWSGSQATRRLTRNAFSTDMMKLGQAPHQAPRPRYPFLSPARASDAGLSISSKKKAASRGLLRSTGKNGLFDDLVQLAPGVTLGHLFQRDDLDLAGAAGAAEGLETG